MINGLSDSMGRLSCCDTNRVCITTSRHVILCNMPHKNNADIRQQQQQQHLRTGGDGVSVYASWMRDKIMIKEGVHTHT